MERPRKSAKGTPAQPWNQANQPRGAAGIGFNATGIGKPTTSRHRTSISQPSTNTNQVPTRREVKLITNAYSVKSSLGHGKIYEHQIRITSDKYKEKHRVAEVISKSFVTRAIRQLIMEEVVPNLVMSSGLEDNSNTIVISTNLESLFSLEPLKSPSTSIESSCKEEATAEFTFTNLPVKTDLLTLLHINVHIKYIRTFSLDSLTQSHSHRGLVLSSVLHHKLLITMLKYGTTYFETSHEQQQRQHHQNRLDLISRHIMGFSISGLRHSINQDNFITINCPHSYITHPHRLIDLLASFIMGKSVTDIPLRSSSSPPGSCHIIPEIASVIGSEEWFMSFCGIVSGFKCISNNDMTKLRFQMTEQPASSLLTADGTNTVQDYYLKQLNIPLTYPNLPCLQAKQNFYPLELCSLLPDQKVPIFRLSSSAKAHLSNLNKPKPFEFFNSSKMCRNNLMNYNRDLFRKFNLEISDQPLETTGSTLAKPSLQYKSTSIEPTRDMWESGPFCLAKNLIGNWCVVNTVEMNMNLEKAFFEEFSSSCRRYGFIIDRPHFLYRSKEVLMSSDDSLDLLIKECQRSTNGNLTLVMFVIDSSSTQLNRKIHLAFDEHNQVTATCLRNESILNFRQRKSIFRTLVHKLNARLGGTNVVYHESTFSRLNFNSRGMMVIGLDVTHPDNELNGVSIVGCAYSFGDDLFRHKSLVWPQAARVEIIGRVDSLMKRLLHEYYSENGGKLPKKIVVYRDGVSHEEFETVRKIEIAKAKSVLTEIAKKLGSTEPDLSYVIAQKRHTMRFFHKDPVNNLITNPPSGTLINRDIVGKREGEFYLYSNTSSQATSRPLHYHILLDGLGVENLQKLTYMLCFNFGKCSGTLSMPSSLKYAHNAAYDARNRVINAKEFIETIETNEHEDSPDEDLSHTN